MGSHDMVQDVLPLGHAQRHCATPAARHHSPASQPVSQPSSTRPACIARHACNRSPAFTPLRSQVEGACGSAAYRALHLPDGRRAHLDGRDHAAQCRLHRPGMHVCIHARSMRTPRARCACAAHPLHMSAAYHTRCSGHPLRHEQVDGAQGDERRGGNILLADCLGASALSRLRHKHKGDFCTFQNAWCRVPACGVQAEQFEHSENIVHVPRIQAAVHFQPV